MYIAEIAPSEKRGQLVSFNQFNIVIGFSAAYFANYFLLLASNSDAAWVSSLGIDEHAWRWMLGLEAIPALVWLCVLLYIPESPRWLGLNGRVEEARKVLERVRPADRVEKTLADIRESVSESGHSFLVRLKALAAPSLRLPIAIGIIVGITQQVTGINAIFFYAPRIFEQTGVGTNAAFAQAVIVGVVNVVFTIGAMLLIDRLGRKPLLIGGLIGVILSASLAGYGFSQARYELSTESVAALSESIDVDKLEPLIGIEFESDISFKQAASDALGTDVVRDNQATLIQAAIRVNPYIILIGILGFVASFAISLGPVMWVLFSELYPNRIRGIAMAFVGFFNSASSAVVTLVFPWQVSNLGSATTFFIYSGLGVVGLVLLAKLLPETKGKSLEQLEAEFGSA
jgi:MFS family permease